MASASTTFLDALWDAAKDADIPDVNHGSCWPLLKMFLKCRSVDLGTRTEAEVMKAFNRHRHTLKKELGEDKGKGERSPSTESERKSETASLSDSAYHSESSQDHGDHKPLQPFNVHASVEPSTDYPAGEAFLTGCISDDTDEDYILQTIFGRLKIPKGKDGKVSIAYTPDKGETRCRSSFAVRKDEDGHADIVFARKRPGQKEKTSQSKQHTEDHGPRDLSRSREASQRLQQRVEDPKFENIIARIFLDRKSQEISDEGAANLGRKVMLAVQGGNAVNET